MVTISGRALHYVFKIADRKLTAHFYRNVLGMKVLRHEEFSEGCEAACNGPYANRWSKTMIGYGPEDNHFVIELTYNYPVKSYEKGNDFIGITIRGKEILERAKKENWPILPDNTLEAPGGYKFFIVDETQPTDKDPIEKVTLASACLNTTLNYWHGIFGMKILDKTNDSVLLAFSPNETKLEFVKIEEPINRGTSYGRIAYSCPFSEQPKLVEEITNKKEKILTPLTSLDTPGKATVRVVILSDPDGHEICFVDDEGFRKLSQVDPEGEILLDRYIKKDSS